jgi:poly-gamma-glutamate capsule biosynthesis protein CapA/YwtB (metallophosphatase superfamily)
MSKTELLFCGDFVISEGISYQKNNINSCVLDMFKSSDFNVVNLECPVTDATNSNKINKTGPHLKGNSNDIEKILKELKIDLVTLANNHVLDYGKKGLKDTINFCNSNNINHLGAGENLNSSNKAFRKKINGINISILNFAENEWSSAKENEAGANPLDVIDNVEQIKEEKNNTDIVIVIIHGGHEFYSLPNPRMVKQYRYYADNGADLIIGHHPHCISGSEVHNGTPIHYSLGNFIFTKPSKYADWYTGLILKVVIDKDKKISCEPIPTFQDKTDYSIKLHKEENKKNVLKSIENYSNIIKDKSKLKEEWNKYVALKSDTYLNIFSPLTFINNNLLRAIFYKIKVYKFIKSKNTLKLYLNLMRCEAHSDLSKAIIEKKIKK